MSVDTTTMAETFADAAKMDGPIPSRKLGLKSFAELKPSYVSWLWFDMIPLGMGSVAFGAGGAFKSAMAAWVAARATRGELPGSLQGKPCDVVWLSLEESYEQVLYRRLTLQNADMSRIHYPVIRKLEEDGSMSELAATTLKVAGEVDVLLTEHPEVKLIVLDPLVDILDPDNMNDRQSVNRVLRPFNALAEKHGVAVLGINHKNKSADQSGVNAMSGSKAISDTLRSSLQVASVQTDPESRLHYHGVVSQTKSNNGPKVSWEFTVDIEHVDPTDPLDRGFPVFRLGSETETTADEFERSHAADAKNTRSEKVEARKEWLREVLEEKGPIKRAELVRLAGEHGWSSTDVDNLKSQAFVTRDNGVWSLNREGAAGEQ
jgi:AAA domain-containing protein